MLVACFDLEGVFLPEIWIEVAKITGIDDLLKTTRDVKDYNELMTFRLKVLEENHISLSQIQDVIATIKPVEGAREFLDWARANCQVVILSDTFYEFAEPLMDSLGRPTLFCHNLTIEKDKIIDYNLRIEDPKRKAVLSFKSLNFSTFACGDSYNDTTMIIEADHGCFFRAPDNVLADFPDYKGLNSFSELKEEIKNYL